MKVLVTGGAGFIGSHTIKKLLEIGHDVVCLDNFNDYYNPNIKEKNISPFLKDISLYRQDICNYEELMKIIRTEKIDKICHLAAQVGVRPSIENPFIYEEVNVKGTLNLLEAAKHNNISDFVFASSSSVYGNNTKIPFSETDQVDFPISPYASTKKATELLAYNYQHLYKINCTGLRLFTVYGPCGRMDMAPFIFTDSIYKGKEIKRFGDGNSKRDYTFIDDIVSGIISSLKNPYPYEIINLGNNNSVELNYFISLIENLLNKKACIKEYTKQAGDVDITYADISKAKKLLNYNPLTTIEQGMKKFIDWYLMNQEFFN